MKKVLVAGSSGFIGGHLARHLKEKGYFVIGVDTELPQYGKCNIFYQVDLRDQIGTHQIFKAHQDIQEVYLLAAMMGGMGFIGDSTKSYDIMIGSTQIIANILDCSVRYGVKKIFYSSSACVYNQALQEEVDSIALKEETAFPANPDLMYGWQKITGELMCKSAQQTHGIDIKIARFHNVFGHEGTYDGGKEKAPAALARKVAEAEDGGTITVWGDGKQTRSFLFIEECLEGVDRLMESDHTEPINIGSEEGVSITSLAEMLIEISGKNLSIEYDLSKPQGVRGRNSDNSKILEVLNWKPTKPLRDGLKALYAFVDSKINTKNKAA